MANSDETRKPICMGDMADSLIKIEAKLDELKDQMVEIRISNLKAIGSGVAAAIATVGALAAIVIPIVVAIVK